MIGYKKGSGRIEGGTAIKWVGRCNEWGKKIVVTKKKC